MSSDLAAPPVAPTRRGQPLILCALVAAAVVVGYVLFDHWWSLHGFSRVARIWDSAPLDVYGFVGSMVPAALLAIVLAVWGIDARHRVAGALGALVVGLVGWGLQEVMQRWIFERDHMSQATLRTYDWVVTLTIPTLVTIAWGLARRRGTLWWLGVLVAPLLAGLHHQASLYSARWQSWEFGHEDWWIRSLEFLAPIVVACIVCWLIDAGTRRTPHASAAPLSDMQSSASSEDVQPRRSRG